VTGRSSSAILAALFLLAAGCRAKKEQTAPPQAASVERRTITIDASATGVVEPINVVEVKSKASGLITRMTVETGAEVKPGDLLVQVDTRDVQNQYDQSLADLKSAQARMQVSAAQKKRSDEMHAARVITAQEHETASLDYTNAQAQLVRAETNLDLAKQRLEDATVSAPVSGTIIEKTVSLGQVITSATGAFGGGTTLLKMADLGRVRVRALFNETDIGQIGPGQMATVTVDAYPDRRFQGLVEKIEPQAVVQQGVTLFPVLVTLDNEESLLKPGMNGEVSVLVDERPNVLAVPNDAVKNTREAAVTAPMLGLDPDSVQSVVRTQFASMGGGRGNFGGGNGGSGRQSGGDVAGRANAPTPTGMAASPAPTGSPRRRDGANGAAGNNGAANGADRSAAAPGGGADPTDADCKAVADALTKAGAQAKLDALRGRVQSGELDFAAMRDESRTIYESAGVDARTAGACRRRERGGAAGGPGSGGGATRRDGGALPNTRSANTNAARTGDGRVASTAAVVTPRRTRPQPRLVFVQKVTVKDTTWEPRLIMAGASNFDYTEVISGLQEGEQVAMLASLTLQAQRQAQNDRFRQNMGGVPGLQQGGGGPGGARPGGGGGGGAPRGGGGGGRP
jgi:HlyD family secretion protein